MATHPAIRRATETIEDISERVGVDLLECDRCGHEMKVRATQVTDDPCKNDIRIKCPLPTPENDYDGCGWWTRHGISISRENYNFEMSERDHSLVDAVNTNYEETTVEDRLANLGYLDK